jgi:uncharacterized protein (TIGR00725 family)
VRYVAVVGGSVCNEAAAAQAEEVGRRIAEAGAVLITGGREGIAEAACKGANEAGGTAVGVLPSRSRSGANPWVTVALPTGLGETRNALVVMDADAVIAFPGQYGTLSEIAHALLAGTPVIGLGSWDIEGVVPAADPADAVAKALG